MVQSVSGFICLVGVETEAPVIMIIRVALRHVPRANLKKAEMRDWIESRRILRHEDFQSHHGVNGRTNKLRHKEEEGTILRET